jgi:hypothetical protein
MIVVKKKSLKKQREEKKQLPEVEQSVTELEIRDIEKDLQLTDLEIEVLELQEKVGE